MTQNMFMEGLYHVFFKETPATRPQTQVANDEELGNARIHRWFGTVVNTRLLVTGVVQVLSALACILTTVTHACVSYNCSVSMTTPVWSSLSYVAAGCLAMEVQRKANKLKIITLMGLNLFSLLFGFSALLANSLTSTQLVALNTNQQRAGSYVARGSSITFSVQCFLASVYIIFLSWRGLRRYSPPHTQTYSRLSQDPDETNGPLLEQVEFSL
ncbi:transmembrane protein 253 [Trachinotus anak]|uniref:transmembrane protein 253 n=1 Tax=Trachinotus anak TaxID=443729 RepID=UPI0039F20DB9